jgi:hypothetical protein
MNFFYIELFFDELNTAVLGFAGRHRAMIAPRKRGGVAKGTCSPPRDRHSRWRCGRHPAPPSRSRFGAASWCPGKNAGDPCAAPAFNTTRPGPLGATERDILSSQWMERQQQQGPVEMHSKFQMFTLPSSHRIFEHA